jgi:hypothetical protein
MPDNQNQQLKDSPPLASNVAGKAPTNDGPGPEDRLPSATTLVATWEKKTLYAALFIFLALMFIFLGRELVTQESNFQQGADLAKETFEKVASSPDSRAYRPDVALLYTFQFSRALEAAHIKTAAIILGTLIVCLGCIVVVYGVEASYQLTVNPKTPSPSSLTTSSPGLVLITLGVLVIVVAQLIHSKFNTSVDWVMSDGQTISAETNPATNQGPNAHQFPTPKLP